MEQIADNTAGGLMLIVLSLLFSIRSIRKLWRSQASQFDRIFWTAVLLMPVLGPLMFAAFYNMPAVKPSSQQAAPNRNAWRGP